MNVGDLCKLFVAKVAKSPINCPIWSQSTLQKQKADAYFASYIMYD